MSRSFFHGYKTILPLAVISSMLLLSSCKAADVFSMIFRVICIALWVIAALAVVIESVKLYRKYKRSLQENEGSIKAANGAEQNGQASDDLCEPEPRTPCELICPLCNGKLTLRQNGKTQKWFYGCENYFSDIKCRFTADISVLNE